MYFTPKTSPVTYTGQAGQTSDSPLLRRGALSGMRGGASFSDSVSRSRGFFDYLKASMNEPESGRASAQTRVIPTGGVEYTPRIDGDPEIVKADPPNLDAGITVKDGMIYFKGDYVAGIDLNKGGQLDQLFYGGEQLLSGNGMWMHSSPEGAADGTGLGYEMATQGEPTVKVEGNQVIVEGKLMQSNGSGRYAGHRYRRTYTFDQADSFTVKHEMWVSPEDRAKAKEEFGEVPESFYVWACPIDANLPNYYWNADSYWEGVADHWNERQTTGLDLGRIPDRPDGRLNWGYTTTLDRMGSTPTSAIYRPGGPAIVRQVVDGDMAQINFWRNMEGHSCRTLEFSVIGGDRHSFDPDYKASGLLRGGEQFGFTERITVGQSSRLVPGSSYSQVRRG